VTIVVGVLLLVLWAVPGGQEDGGDTAAEARTAARVNEGASSEQASTGGAAAKGALGLRETSDFQVRLTDGQPFSLSEYRGRVVVVEFLAPGCVSCAEELAVLSRVAEDFKDRGVVVLVLDVSGMPRDKIAGYYQGLGAGELLLYAPDERLQVARQYQVQYLGTTIVLRGDGKEAYRDGEGTQLAELIDAVRAAS